MDQLQAVLALAFDLGWPGVIFSWASDAAAAAFSNGPRPLFARLAFEFPMVVVVPRVSWIWIHAEASKSHVGIVHVSRQLTVTFDSVSSSS